MSKENFKIKIAQPVLEHALKVVKNTIGRGADNNNPYERCVYMEVVKIKGMPSLKLTTTNLNEVTVNLVELVEGTLGKIAPIIEFKLLEKLVATISPKANIEIKAVDEETVELTYANRKKPIILRGRKSKNFMYNNPPTKYNDSVSIPASDFKECIEKSSQIINDSGDSNIFNCCKFVFGKGQVLVRCMDSAKSKRILMFAISTKTKVETSFLVESHKAKKIIPFLDLDKNVRLSINENIFAIEQGVVKFYIRNLEGELPDLARFILPNYKIKVSFVKEELIKALTRIKIMAEQGKKSGSASCTLTIKEDKANIDVMASAGEISETVRCNTDGDNITVAFSVNYLIDTINKIDEEDISLCFNNSSSTVVQPTKKVGYMQRILIPAVRNEIK